MSTRPQSPPLEVAFTRSEKHRFDRLERRIAELFEARARPTTALCGTLQISGRPFVELFGCVRIPTEEFLEYDDGEISALVRFQTRTLRDPKVEQEMTKELIRLAG